MTTNKIPSKHGLSGRPSNRTIYDESKKMKRRAFSESDEFWDEYKTTASNNGLKTTAWMRQVLREATKQQE